jgi:hypothetical protein
MTDLYRPMKADGPYPRLVDSASGLGIRVGTDIAPDPDGSVRGGMGGLSVTPEDPDLIPFSMRPRPLGGRGRLPLWCLKSESLAPDLADRRDAINHAVVEPAREMAISDYRAAIAGTQQTWILVIP